MRKGILLAIASALVVSCGGAFPFPYPQTAPIPPFSGRIHGWCSESASVGVKGHPENCTIADRDGNFLTSEGSDFYFGMDQVYFSRAYRITVTTNGKISKSWQTDRPPLIGRYKGQPYHNKAIGLGHLR
jgi:hypothetical protein